MKHLRIWYVDVSRDSIGPLLQWLAEEYELRLTPEDPDFVLHSCFGRDVLRYRGVRIAWYGENVQPDFNVSDYATGFADLSYGDRYRRIPLYRWYLPDYESLFDGNRNVRRVDGRAELQAKTRFCTCVVSNALRGPYFESILAAVQQYKKIDSGGRWGNNVGGPVRDKLAFLRQGKFHLAFENSSAPGYVTEKIMHAFSARTIPVYWGAPDVARDFNPNAFINCHQYASVEGVAGRIRELDGDESQYVAMLQEPCFKDGLEPANLRKASLLAWYRSIFDQPREAAYRRNRHHWGARYEADLFTAHFQPHVQAARLLLRPLKRRIRALVNSSARATRAIERD